MNKEATPVTISEQIEMLTKTVIGIEETIGIDNESTPAMAPATPISNKVSQIQYDIEDIGHRLNRVLDLIHKL